MSPGFNQQASCVHAGNIPGVNLITLSMVGGSTFHFPRPPGSCALLRLRASDSFPTLQHLVWHTAVPQEMQDSWGSSTKTECTSVFPPFTLCQVLRWQLSLSACFPHWEITQDTVPCLHSLCWPSEMMPLSFMWPDQARLSPETGLSRGQLLLALGYYYCYLNRGRSLLVPHLYWDTISM